MTFTSAWLLSTSGLHCVSHVLVYFRRHGGEGTEKLGLCADGLQFSKSSGAKGGFVHNSDFTDRFLWRSKQTFGLKLKLNYLQLATKPSYRISGHRSPSVRVRACVCEIRATVSGWHHIWGIFYLSVPPLPTPPPAVCQKSHKIMILICFIAQRATKTTSDQSLLSSSDVF